MDMVHLKRKPSFKSYSIKANYFMTPGFLKPGKIPGFLFYLNILSVTCFAQIKTNKITEFGVVADIDSNLYKTIKIGSQIWMTENLKVTRYRNGEPIELVSDSAKWKSFNGPAYCYFQNDSSNFHFLGKLYNWFAIDNFKGICPAGWHVPKDSEWKKLEKFLGMPVAELDEYEARGVETNIGNKLKSADKNLWNHPSDFSELNTSGFTAFPAGYRNENGQFNGLNEIAMWWTASDFSGEYAWIRSIYFDNTGIDGVNLDKHNGLSVRCIKD